MCFCVIESETSRYLHVYNCSLDVSLCDPTLTQSKLGLIYKTFLSFMN